jgi:NAD(P)-dependent dehydrogenase (short-subunit alcohol dehydrogenase family)
MVDARSSEREEKSMHQITQRFTGKTFLVTGAGTGFGAELAVRAAREGATQVLVHYRSSAAGAQATAARVTAAGANSAARAGRHHLVGGHPADGRVGVR